MATPSVSLNTEKGFYKFIEILNRLEKEDGSYRELHLQDFFDKRIDLENSDPKEVERIVRSVYENARDVAALDPSLKIPDLAARIVGAEEIIAKIEELCTRSTDGDPQALRGRSGPNWSIVTGQKLIDKAKQEVNSRDEEYLSRLEGYYKNKDYYSVLGINPVDVRSREWDAASQSYNVSKIEVESAQHKQSLAISTRFFELLLDKDRDPKVYDRVKTLLDNIKKASENLSELDERQQIDAKLKDGRFPFSLDAKSPVAVLEIGKGHAKDGGTYFKEFEILGIEAKDIKDIVEGNASGEVLRTIRARMRVLSEIMDNPFCAAAGAKEFDYVRALLRHYDKASDWEIRTRLQVVAQEELQRMQKDLGKYTLEACTSGIPEEIPMIDDNGNFIYKSGEKQSFWDKLRKKDNRKHQTEPKVAPYKEYRTFGTMFNPSDTDPLGDVESRYKARMGLLENKYFEALLGANLITSDATDQGSGVSMNIKPKDGDNIRDAALAAMKDDKLSSSVWKGMVDDHSTAWKKDDVEALKKILTTDRDAIRRDDYTDREEEKRIRYETAKYAKVKAESEAKVRDRYNKLVSKGGQRWMRFVSGLYNIPKYIAAITGTVKYGGIISGLGFAAAYAVTAFGMVAAAPATVSALGLMAFLSFAASGMSAGTYNWACQRCLAGLHHRTQMIEGRINALRQVVIEGVEDHFALVEAFKITARESLRFFEPGNRRKQAHLDYVFSKLTNSFGLSTHDEKNTLYGRKDIMQKDEYAKIITWMTMGKSQLEEGEKKAVRKLIAQEGWPVSFGRVVKGQAAVDAFEKEYNKEVVLNLPIPSGGLKERAYQFLFNYRQGKFAEFYDMSRAENSIYGDGAVRFLANAMSINYAPGTSQYYQGLNLLKGQYKELFAKALEASGDQKVPGRFVQFAMKQDYAMSMFAEDAKPDKKK